jgi:hypothetical protein
MDSIQASPVVKLLIKFEADKTRSTEDVQNEKDYFTTKKKLKFLSLKAIHNLFLSRFFSMMLFIWLISIQ